MSEINKKFKQDAVIVVETKDGGRNLIPHQETIPHKSIGLGIQVAPTPEISNMLLENTPRLIPKTIVTAVSPEFGKTCTDTGQTNLPGVHLSELLLRLSKIEMKITKLESRSSPTHQAPDPEIKSTIHQVHNISRQVEFIMECLRSTPDYNIGKTFNCDSCGTIGTVAIKIKCTECKHERWWGRWP